MIDRSQIEALDQHVAEARSAVDAAEAALADLDAGAFLSRLHDLRSALEDTRAVCGEWLDRIEAESMEADATMEP